MRYLLLPTFTALCLVIFLHSLMPPSVPPRSAVIAGAAPKQRLVIYPPVLTGYMTLDEGVSHVVGASAFLPEKTPEVPIGWVYPDVANIPPMVTIPKGTTFPTDPEQVMLREPDAVFVWPGMGNTLKKAGLPVVDI